jgi:hypothetical protein
MPIYSTQNARGGITIWPFGKEGQMAKIRATRGADDDGLATEAETLRSELARVRARFGLDPDVPVSVLAHAWTPPVGSVEDDEAEFVDAVADCVSVGLPLTAAVASWASGVLAREDESDDDPGESRIR